MGCPPLLIPQFSALALAIQYSLNMLSVMADARAVFLSRFLLVLCCLTLHAAPPTVKLTIIPDFRLINDPPGVVRFVAKVASADKPSSVTLCLVDKEGVVLSTHGGLRDDGSPPDQVAGDMEYSSQLPIPLDKQGEFRFLARARFKGQKNPVDSPVTLFDVRFTTPQNAEGDLWAQCFDDSTCLAYLFPRVCVKRVKFFRAESASGPWRLLFDDTSDETCEEGRAEAIDDSKLATSRDWYYKIELYDSRNRLTKSYSPVFVPAFAEGDRLLRLVGAPLKSQAVPAAPTKQ